MPTSSVIYVMQSNIIELELLLVQNSQLKTENYVKIIFCQNSPKRYIVKLLVFIPCLNSHKLKRYNNLFDLECVPKEFMKT
jgi:hypothetical protein